MCYPSRGGGTSCNRVKKLRLKIVYAIVNRRCHATFQSKRTNFYGKHGVSCQNRQQPVRLRCVLDSLYVQIININMYTAFRVSCCRTAIVVRAHSRQYIFIYYFCPLRTRQSVFTHHVKNIFHPRLVMQISRFE